MNLKENILYLRYPREKSIKVKYTIVSNLQPCVRWLQSSIVVHSPFSSFPCFHIWFNKRQTHLVKPISLHYLFEIVPRLEKIVKTSGDFHKIQIQKHFPTIVTLFWEFHATIFWNFCFHFDHWWSYRRTCELQLFYVINRANKNSN